MIVNALAASPFIIRDHRIDVNEKSLFDIDHLIPHRAPLRLIDRILQADEDHIEALSVVKESWPLCHSQGADVILAIEVIAQGAAALHGYRKGWQDEPRVGFLVGVKEARFYAQYLPLKAELTVNIEIVSLIGNYGVFKGEVRLGDGLICEALVQAMEPDDELFGKLVKDKV
jgi:predicted hotdog family 3-hydroxylacyl-ACP dehydratase